MRTQVTAPYAAPVDRVLIIFVRLGEMLICALPPRSVPVLSWTLGSLWYAFDRRRRRRCRANLNAAFGKDAPEASEFHVREVFRNMARVPLEALWFPRLFATPEQMERRCVFEGDWDALRATEHTGGVMLGGHLGNWELGAHGLRINEVATSVVVRQFAQAQLERRLAASRGGDAVVIPHDAVLSGMRKALRAKRWVGVLGDQNAGWNAQFVPFFGIPASTATLPAWVALKGGQPVFIGAATRRAAFFSFTFHLAPAQPPPDLGPREATAWTIEFYMATLEAWTRRAPTQYNWLHRRWKSRPPGEAPNPRLPVYDHHRPSS